MVRERKLSVGLLNPCSLGTGHDEFISAVSHHNVDLLAINETWLRDGEEGRAPTVPGYRLRHTPRPAHVRARGGGVGFYIKHEFAARMVPINTHNSIEQIWFKLSLANFKFIIGTAYRPPWLSVRAFLDALSDTISALRGYDFIMVLGDFNINYLNSSSGHTKMLQDFLTTYNLRQHVNEPTHHTNNSDTLLDLICSNANITRVEVDYIPDLSSHSFVYCELGIAKFRFPAKQVMHRPLKYIDTNQLNELLIHTSWEEVSRLQNVNDMVSLLNRYILSIFDTLAPVKKIFIKERHCPWLTSNLKLMMQLRNKAHVKARKSGSDLDVKYYKDLKKHVVISLKTEKAAYFNTYINENLKNPRILWNNIKQHITFNNNKNFVLPSSLDDVNVINCHFLQVPGAYYASLHTINAFEQSTFCASSLKFTLVDEESILKIIRALQSNAIGSDGVSLTMLKSTLPYTLKAITSIINNSLLSGTYPSAWQEAIIKPLPKKGNVNSVKDLRPISILPCLSKVLEKVVHAQVSKYIEINNILPVYQSGFRKGHSTTTALSNVVSDFLEAQDKGQGTILVLLDFSRAFDSINRALLYSKLKYYGFSTDTIKWFISYLENRTQIVQVQCDDGTIKQSDRWRVTRGLPQGSILGPLIYSLYSADVTQCIHHCKYHIYADDIQLYISFNPSKIHEAVNLLTNDLNRIAEWAESNTLVLNAEKTKFMVLGTSKQIKKVSELLPTIKIKDKPITRVYEARNLGVLLDQHIRFHKHTLDTVRNCFYRLKILYRIREMINTKVRIQLCESLVLSKFNYADAVIGPRLLMRTKNIIQRVQNACVRYCFNVPPRSHVTPYLNNSRILKMDFRQQLHFATLLFSVIKYKIPNYLYSRLHWASDSDLRQATRASSYMLVMKKHQSAAFRGSFDFAATKCWNNLPPPIRNLNTVNSFRIKYKEFLLDVQLKQH